MLVHVFTSTDSKSSVSCSLMALPFLFLDVLLSSNMRSKTFNKKCYKVDGVLSMHTLNRQHEKQLELEAVQCEAG